MAISSLKVELVAEIDSAHVFIADDIGSSALHQNHAVMDDIGPVDHVEGVADVVIGYQHSYAPVLEVGHEVANVTDGDRIDPG